MRSLCGSKKWLAAVLPVSMLLTFASAASAASFAVTTTSLPNGVDGVAFLAQLTSANGTGKVTWVLASGSSLEKGLTLSTALDNAQAQRLYESERYRRDAVFCVYNRLL